MFMAAAEAAAQTVTSWPGVATMLITQVATVAGLWLQTRSNHAANTTTLEGMRSDIDGLKKADEEHLRAYHRAA